MPKPPINPLNSNISGSNLQQRPVNNDRYLFRINIFMILAILGFLVIVYRLFDLQVIKSDYLRGQAVNNKRQIIRLPSYRGEIFLKNGKHLAKNLSSYSIYIMPKNFPRRKQSLENFNALIQRIVTHFNIPEKKILKTLRRSLSNPYRPYLLKAKVSDKEIFYLAEHLDQFPGLIYQDSLTRTYPLANIYSHISGYVQTISPKELREKEALGYGPNSIIGKTGVEAYYDLDLRGKDGYKVHIVDVKNRIKEEIYPQDGQAVPGKNIYLSIDPRVQNILHRTMKGMPGGAIVTKVSSGEIVGLYSYPFYDPNIFNLKNNREIFNQYSSDVRNPFLNRTIQAQYPPSSIFKIILSLAALDDPKITVNNTSYYCEGKLVIGDSIFKCTGYHGRQNFMQAIANSCNVFFYNLGIRISPQVIEEYAKTYFKFGQKTGVDLAYEKEGRIPTPKWKIENRGAFWWDGDTANFSIGQGFTLTTMMQVNTMTTAIANNGKAYQPHLVNKMESLQDGSIQHIQPRLMAQLPFASDHVKYIQKSMLQVVRWGTAHRIQDDSLQIAGKTGTAQIIKSKENHAWFTGYAPYKKFENKSDQTEQLAVTVLVEHGGFGSVYPATFASAILQAIFKKRDPVVVIKEKLQKWQSMSDKYEYWLKVRKESRLPESYFDDDKS